MTHDSKSIQDIRLSLCLIHWQNSQNLNVKVMKNKNPLFKKMSAVLRYFDPIAHILN